MRLRIKPESRPLMDKIQSSRDFTQIATVNTIKDEQSLSTDLSWIAISSKDTGVGNWGASTVMDFDYRVRYAILSAFSETDDADANAYTEAIGYFKNAVLGKLMLSATKENDQILIPMNNLIIKKGDTLSVYATRNSYATAGKGDVEIMFVGKKL